jgi:hypothetical protein
MFRREGRGVATTTDQSGYLAATLADRLGQPRSTEALVADRPSSSGDVSALEARFHREMVRVHGRARDEARCSVSVATVAS